MTKAELEKLISSSSVTLIDANGNESYRQGHIPSAIDLGAHLRDFNTILPRDKNALIVAYCGGESCKAYETATKGAIALGYTNVKHYAGGLRGWVSKGRKLVKVNQPAP